MFGKSFILFACFQSLAIVAEAVARTSPPYGAIVVSNESQIPGCFSTIQSALDSLSTTSYAPQAIFIYPGVYDEQVYIAPRTAQLTIYGYTNDSTSYHDNCVTITHGLSQDTVPSNDLTAAVRAWAKGLKVYNINLKNTRGKGRQALALSAQADQQGYYGVQLIGYQDTLLANTGKQIYARSYIEGAVDFIFGQRARAWFEQVDIGVKDSGTITASGRDSASNPNYYVFNNCSVDVAPGYTVRPGSTYLGRPWRDWARVVFQNTYISSVVNSAGWSVWQPGTEQTDHVYYKEFKNTGPGSQGLRASFSGTLHNEITIGSIIGSGYASWVDTSYL